jgi:Domain of unknown function (DUF4337)
MSDAMEHAHHAMHQGHEEHASHANVVPWAKLAAVLISILAATLALVGIGEKQAHTEYLAHHVERSNGWAFYQAKNMRAVTRESEAAMLESLPNASDPAIQARIKDAKEYAARMRDEPRGADGSGGDGMKQLADKNADEERLRDHYAHLYHSYEFASGAVEIAIVLASVSVVTGVATLAFASAALGAGAGIYALGVLLHLF